MVNHVHKGESEVGSRRNNCQTWGTYATTKQ